MSTEAGPTEGGRPAHSGAFATTCWSVVLEAGGGPGGSGDSVDARRALGELYQRYWYPLYTYIRRQGQTPDAAQDFVQELFTRFLANDQLSRVSPDRGRFRSYLLASVNHLLAGEWQKRSRQKRGGGAAPVALDALTAEERYRVEPADGRSPEAAFDRQWALAMLERAFEAIRREWEAAGKAALFAALRPFVSGDGGTEGYGELCRAVGMSEGAARVAVHRLRAEFRDRLRAEVMETLADPGGVDDELRHLLSALRDPGAVV